MTRAEAKKRAGAILAGWLSSSMPLREWQLDGLPLAEIAAIRAEYKLLVAEVRKLARRKPSGPLPDPGPIPQEHDFSDRDKRGNAVCKHCKAGRSVYFYNGEKVCRFPPCTDPATGKRVRW